MSDDLKLLEAAPVSVVRTLLALIADPAGCSARMEELRAGKKEIEDLLITCGRREMALEKREQALREREEAASTAEHRSHTAATAAFQQLEALRDFSKLVDDRVEAVTVREKQVASVISRLERSEFRGLFSEGPEPLQKPDLRGKSGGSRQTQFKAAGAYDQAGGAA